MLKANCGQRDETKAQQRMNQLQVEVQRLTDVVNKRRTLGIELALAEAEMLKENSPPYYTRWQIACSIACSEMA
jgi:hypothetical protein